VYPEVPATITIDFGVEQVFSIELFVDGVSREVVNGCGFDCGFYNVELDEGMHELRIVGDGEVDDNVFVFVGDGPSEDTGDTTSSGDTTGDGDGDTTTSGDGGDGSTGTVDAGDGESEEDGDTSDGNDEADDGTGGELDNFSGRGCEIASSTSPLGLLALPALLLLPAIRRRRD
jgi:MYXO-CTERM domain-containing protein